MSHEHHHEHDRCECGSCRCHDSNSCSCSSCHEHDHGHCHDDGCGCHHHHSEKPISKRLMALIPSAVILLVSFFIPDSIITTALLLLAYILVGYETLFDAAKTLIKEHTVDESFLMSIASIGAIAVGEIKEAVAVMLFYSIGQILEEVAQNRSKKSIRALMDLHPDIVSVKRNGEILKLAPEEVLVGETLVILPGERIPLDGVITDGSASIDYSALTGESLPVSADLGVEVYGGGINLSTAIEIRATKPYAQSSSARIIAMVEDARGKKAKSEKFISKFSRKYTLIVCLAALVVAFIFPIFTGYAESFTRWLYVGLTFLVVSCPCALVISVPLTFFAGLGCASTNGILIKSTACIESLSKLKAVALDKTGTVTKGKLHIVNSTLSDNDFSLCAHAESKSTHPVAVTVANSCAAIDDSRITSAEEIPNRGVKAIVDSREVLVGNLLLMSDNSVSVTEPNLDGVTVYCAIDGNYAGSITLADEIKPDSESAVSKLKSLGLSRIVMLTGDSHNNAEAVCSQVGITEIHSQLTPEDKCNKLSEIISETNGMTAFVGDGINDAPVLSMTDIGVAMGGLGADSAIETADVVILDDSLAKLPKAVKISRRTMSIVIQNISFALGAKLLVMILTVIGITNMWLAVFADIGVMLIAVLNALRALKYRH